MGEVPSETWRERLRKLSTLEWIRGIKALNASLDEWPPSLPEFKRWAVGGLTVAEAKSAAIDEWDNRPPAKYNPFNTPLSYDQEDTARRNFIQSRVANAAMSTANDRLGLDNDDPFAVTDPRRICQDEELM